MSDFIVFIHLFELYAWCWFSLSFYKFTWSFCIFPIHCKTVDVELYLFLSICFERLIFLNVFEESERWFSSHTLNINLSLLHKSSVRLLSSKLTGFYYMDFWFTHFKLTIYCIKHSSVRMSSPNVDMCLVWMGNWWPRFIFYLNLLDSFTHIHFRNLWIPLFPSML